MVGELAANADARDLGQCRATPCPSSSALIAAVSTLPLLADWPPKSGSWRRFADASRSGPWSERRHFLQAQPSHVDRQQKGSMGGKHLQCLNQGRSEGAMRLSHSIRGRGFLGCLVLLRGGRKRAPECPRARWWERAGGIPAGAACLECSEVTSRGSKASVRSRYFGPMPRETPPLWRLTKMTVRRTPLNQSSIKDARHFRGRGRRNRPCTAAGWHQRAVSMLWLPVHKRTSSFVPLELMRSEISGWRRKRRRCRCVVAGRRDTSALRPGFHRA